MKRYAIVCEDCFSCRSGVLSLMQIRHGYKFRLKAKPKNRLAFAKQAGCCRFVWNHFLAVQNARRAEDHKLLSNYEMNNLLPALKIEHPFLKEVHSICLQATTRDLSHAISNFFNPQMKNDWPVFKKKGKVNDSFRYPQGAKLDHENSRVFLPKVGYIRYFNSRPIDSEKEESGVLGKIKNVTVSRHGKDWSASIQTERTMDDPVHPSKTTVGIDCGVRVFAVMSNGTFIRGKRPYASLEQRLARAQRKLSRRQKGSCNRRKQQIRVNKIHTKIADVRCDFLHKQSTTTAKNHSVVVLEDLKIGNMTRSAAGTKESPGKNVKAKSGLNKSILDQGWGAFRTMLDYKLRERGGRLVLINPAYTSQECPACHTIAAANRKGAHFKCLTCGFTADADWVASVNIKAAGLAVLACGGDTVVPAVRNLCRSRNCPDTLPA